MSHPSCALGLPDDHWVRLGRPIAKTFRYRPPQCDTLGVGHFPGSRIRGDPVHQMSHPGVHSRAGGRAARTRREPACTCWAALHCMRCALSFCPPPERAARAGVNCSSLLQPFSQAGCNRAMLVPLAFSIAVAINASGSPPSDHQRRLWQQRPSTRVAS